MARTSVTAPTASPTSAAVPGSLSQAFDPYSVSYSGSSLPGLTPGTLSPQVIAALQQQAQQAGQAPKPQKAPQPGRWDAIMAAYGMPQPQQKV